MYLVHYTSLRDYERILKDGSIKPIGLRNETPPRYPNLSPEEWVKYRRLSIKERNEYKRNVFLSLLPVIKGKGAWTNKRLDNRVGVYLFLNVELLKGIECSFCPSQDSIINRETDTCVKYESERTLCDNLISWMEILSKNSSNLTFSKNGIIENEIMCKGEIPLKYLEYVYYTNSSKKPPVPFI